MRQIRIWLDKNWRYIRILALGIISVELIYLLKDWLQDYGIAVQAVATVVLVLVTIVYVMRTHAIAKATEKQAKASARMAEEMQRPVIAFEPTSTHLTQARWYPKNVGTGPAMNLLFLSGHAQPFWVEGPPLGAGEKWERLRDYSNMKPNNGQLRALYESADGRFFMTLLQLQNDEVRQDAKQITSAEYGDFLQSRGQRDNLPRTSQTHYSSGDPWRR